MAIGIRRREFVGGLGGVVFGWPLAANAQQPNRARKLGILMPLAENDPESQRRIAALLQMLRQFGWVDGKTIVIETRFAGGNPESLPTLASELVRAKVDVIVTQAAQRGSPADTHISVLHPDGKPVQRVLLRAVRDSYVTFRPLDESIRDCVESLIAVARVTVKRKA
jgi:hypothetical protein